MPKTVGETWSFHRLVAFYRRFIHEFNTITTLIMDCLKKMKYKFGEE